MSSHDAGEQTLLASGLVFRCHPFSQPGGHVNLRGTTLPVVYFGR